MANVHAKHDLTESVRLRWYGHCGQPIVVRLPAGWANRPRPPKNERITAMPLIGMLLSFAVGACILHWIIRTAISGGMKDFERWKREQDRAS